MLIISEFGSNPATHSCKCFCLKGSRKLFKVNDLPLSLQAETSGLVVQALVLIISEFGSNPATHSCKYFCVK